MSGFLGKADLAATANTDLYTVPAGKITTANINLCNRTNVAITARIAIRSDALGDADYLEYDTSIPPHGVLERSGMVLSAGETIVAHASAAGVSVRVHGFEEEA